MPNLDTPLFFFGVTTGIALAAATQYLLNSAVNAKHRKRDQGVSEVDRSEALLGVPLTHDAAQLEMRSFTESLLGSTSASGNVLQSPTAVNVGTTHGRRPSYSVPSFVAADGTLPQLEREFTVPPHRLQTMVRHLVNEMKKGLDADGHTLKMIPSYVVARPKGQETGSYLALDFGGSNFRVCLVELRGNGQSRVRQSKHSISDELKKGKGEALFDFFAKCIGEFLISIGQDVLEPRNIGFTFSFPVQQTALNHGALMHWNKGFECSGVEGQDVVGLLNKSLRKANYKLTVTALVNDTVGTLISHAYRDPQTFVGVILGTGTNAAYVEKMEYIKKWKGKKTTGEMVINTEWGAYDEQSVLPLTSWDRMLDRASLNTGKQIFEKMISGMYLGEIVRYILIDLVSTGELFKGTSSKPLQVPYKFETAYMSRIERDHSLELSDTKVVLEDIMEIPATSVQDRRVVKHVCELVGIRAARLSAAGVAAIITKMNRFDACTVAIDGSVFEHYPHFANRMRDALRELLGIMAENVVLEQARDGSGEGAALIAALHGK
ncbi:hexokinase-domain-containing protein [Fimicolochytrium jonesii]|uniref:hexokinase-domain-containing protein n=1 Tax=Fimicolochytrium jonesii TaxID=1396493 RepID=UPI0022FE9F88|nr:hexokinase-domain-containing protein [Fimicolochytrium jonesii]KAI8817341.1 hexokinase-domain-containing protein [Fimicolochytrium jonesii]